VVTVTLPELADAFTGPLTRFTTMSPELLVTSTLDISETVMLPELVEPSIAAVAGRVTW
jgi:hypothetical protein